MAPVFIPSDGTGQEIPGPPGPTGPPGPVPVISIGTVGQGTEPAVWRSGTDLAPVLNFTLQQGPPGPSGTPGQPVTLAVGDVTTLANGAPASVSITGSPTFKYLNLGLPKGDQGLQGERGTAFRPTSTILARVMTDVTPGTFPAKVVWSSFATPSSRVVVPAGIGSLRIHAQISVDLDGDTPCAVQLEVTKNGEVFNARVVIDLVKTLPTATKASQVGQISTPIYDAVEGDYFELWLTLFGTSSAKINALGTWIALEAFG